MYETNHNLCMCVWLCDYCAVLPRGYAHVLEEPHCMSQCFLPNLTSAFSVSKTFCPLMSRWITWWEWRWERPWKRNVQTINRPIHTESDDHRYYKCEVPKSSCIIYVWSKKLQNGIHVKLTARFFFLFCSKILSFLPLSDPVASKPISGTVWECASVCAYTLTSSKEVK